MRLAKPCLLLLAAPWSIAARPRCEAIGASYAPRSTQLSPDIRYRMTIVPAPPGDATVAERYRFELFDRRSGRRLSSILLDTICGMGRVPCATWQPGRNEEGFFHSAVFRLDADFSPVSDRHAAYAIIFPGFGESEDHAAGASSLRQRPLLQPPACGARFVGAGGLGARRLRTGQRRSTRRRRTIRASITVKA